MSIETPSYKLLKKDGKFELRDYGAHIVAQVTVRAKSFNQAGNEGFRLLADFIFGNNTRKISIPMTAPVEQEKSEKIAMTAPVNVEPAKEDSYTVSFVMPRKYTLATLPRPNNKEVILRKMPARKAAVLRFSGFTNEKTIERRVQELREWLAREKLKVRGNFIVARYNPPWVPWFLRRNEILAPVS